MKKIAFYNKIFPIFASDMIRLSQSGLCLSLHQPQDGFYKGTRFDRSGVFGSLLFQGTEFCGPWFTSYSPTLHDAVQGPAEEFSPIGLPDGRILKIGVGLLKADMAAYDRFCLYPVLDAGQWTVEADGWQARFEHRLEGFYRYEKVISLQGGGRFSIGHSLTPEFSLEADVYNHNFFTLGKLAVGPSREMDFPFEPEGDWRAVYDSVGFTPGGIRFYRPIKEGESVYTGNIHRKGGEGMPYEMMLREGRLSVHIRADVPAFKTVLWANHRIACLEPYNKLEARPGETLRWTLQYTLQNRLLCEH